MKNVKFIPLTAVLIALVFLGNTYKTAAQSTGDGSVPALTGSGAKLPLDKIKLPSA